MRLLAFETSCDETSVAVVVDGVLRANAISSQVRLHAEYGGVVPELATREHLRNLLPVARQALDDASVRAADLDAVAATQGPGLPIALLIGLEAAQSVAYALRRPFLGIHHHEAHLYSPWIVGKPPRADYDALEPHVALVVSGGHTLLARVDSVCRHELLGSTLDDAAGECFDKTAKLLGLPYPGGPQVDRLAEGGDPAAFVLPRPLMNEANDDFSFSGLKTAVRYLVRDRPELLRDPQAVRDLCASVQAAIVDVLVRKTLRAAERNRVGCVTASGGVTCNGTLRRRLGEACQSHGLALRLAERGLCTDNAGMIGLLAERRLIDGAKPSPLDAEIRPGWTLG